MARKKKKRIPMSLPKEKVYARLANLASAARIESLGSPWHRVHCIDICDMVYNLLPHGSGIDNDVVLSIEDGRDNKLVFYSSYHVMNDAGMYDGWVDFKVTVRPVFIGEIDVVVTGKFSKKYADIRDDLSCRFRDALIEMA